MMIDKTAILEKVDLLSLIGGDLRKVATTQGGEYAGACVFCGGRDRFHVQPNRRPHGLFMCRHCTSGKWLNAIDFVIKRDGCDFKTACATLAGGELPTRSTPPPPRAPEAAYQAQGKGWQLNALQAVQVCEKNLWSPVGDVALDWLLGRGLADRTMQKYRLGYSPGAWFGDMHVRRGVVIPCVVSGEVWYLKIATLPGDPVKCKCRTQTMARVPCPKCGELNKYRGVKGNRTAAIFGADDLPGASMALFCEGEFDCMIAFQDLNGHPPAVTFGAADNHPDLATWGAYLTGLEIMFTVYDNDQAGSKGAAWLASLSNRVKRLELPQGVKDINDYYNGGADLRSWFDAQAEGVLFPERV